MKSKILTFFYSAFFASFILCIFGIISDAVQPALASNGSDQSYISVPGLIDFRSKFSDGEHSIEDLVLLAKKRGFKVLAINDHERIAVSYGLYPFRNVLRYKKEYPSLSTHGPEKFLAEIERVTAKYPDMIIIPGCETSPYYYWSGSYLKGDLTLNDYDRRILILNFNKVSDYEQIPSLGNPFSFKYATRLLPGLIVYLVPLIIGLIFIKWQGFFRYAGIVLIILSLLGIADYNPFRSSLFSPYRATQKIDPYQRVIDYIEEKGGYSFWNYPEQKSGVRKHGPIDVNTPPYPEVIIQSHNYTGFSAVYGEIIKVTAPGNIWDKALLEYCKGARKNPPWGISTADFHEDGRHDKILGAYPTTFLVKKVSRADVFDAMKKGRMYCSQGDGITWPRLDYFTVVGDNNKKAVMGETIKTSQIPVIRFRVSYEKGEDKPITLLLIRGGEVLHKFKTRAPAEFELIDDDPPNGELTYYRIIDEKKFPTLVSNPIFIKYSPN